jgi:mannose-6-phosphate isomerase-like protein (cupin superfamily)
MSNQLHPKKMTPEQREQYHQAAEAQIEQFRYEKPLPNGRPKQNTWLVRRPKMCVVIQCVHEGGENNLHYHTNSETSWMVLKGRARFEGVDGKLIAELGPLDGLVLPGGARYKFDTIGDGDLEILQMVAIDDPEQGRGERLNVEPHREWMADSDHLTRY